MPKPPADPSQWRNEHGLMTADNQHGTTPALAAM
jgi:hypothetical protein